MAVLLQGVFKSSNSHMCLQLKKKTKIKTTKQNKQQCCASFVFEFIPKCISGIQKDIDWKMTFLMIAVKY